MLQGLRSICPVVAFTRNLASISKRVYPWMDRHKPYWVDQFADQSVDADVSEMNKEFLQHCRMRASDQLEENLRSVRYESKEWIPNTTQRVGLIGIKLGVYPMWFKNGRKVDCTIIQVSDNHALRYIPPEEVPNVLSLKEPRGYWLNNKQVPAWVNHQRWGIQLVGALSADPAEFTPEWNGLFAKYGVPTKRRISRFLVSPDAALQPGTPLSVHHFRVGDFVDVTARTINRGFQGGIERYGMSGGPAGNGSTKFHRRIGSSAGGGVSSGLLVIFQARLFVVKMKVNRGKRMAGLMGNRFRSSRGQMIVRINPRLSLLYVIGATAGPVHSYCLVHDSWLCNHRRQLNDNPPPMPTWFPSAEELQKEAEALQDDFNDDFSFDLYHDSIHQADDDSITY